MGCATPSPRGCRTIEPFDRSGLRSSLWALAVSRSPAVSTDGAGGDVHRAQWPLLLVLGVPSLVLALAATVVTTYVPVRLAGDSHSTTLIGLLIGIEGIVAMLIPPAVGAWSDRARSRIGGRLPFVVAATPFLAATVALLGFTDGLGPVAILLVAFFAAYYVAYEPYRALYPDAIEESHAGHAQGTQALSRGVGTFLALIGGGALISLAEPTPFVTAAVLSTLGLAMFVRAILRLDIHEPARSTGSGIRDDLRRQWQLVRSRGDLRLYMCANACWELAFSALKTFIALYLTVGRGFSLTQASLVIGGVALLLLAASPISGSFGDRYGRMRVMQWSLLVYGIALLVPFVVRAPAVIIPVVPIIALGGGVVMTLPYAILQRLMRGQDHGALTGLYSFSRGAGTVLGPLLVGLAVTLTSDSLFERTNGYQAMWGIIAAATLLSLWPLVRLRRIVGA